MSDFVEFAFDDGTLLALQVFAPLPTALAEAESETDDDGAVPGFGTSRPVARGGRVMAATESALGALLAPLVPLLQRVHDTVVTTPDAPDELSVSFGLRVSQDLKLCVVGATGEATMTITANWHLSSPAAPAPAVAAVDSAAGSPTGVRAG
jgi:Trypsin-co-occurring domain 1